MKPLPWRTLLSRNVYSVLFSVLSLAALGFTLNAIVDVRYRMFLDHHDQLARHAVATTKQEIQNYFVTQRHLFSLFVDNNSSRIQSWSKTPSNSRLAYQLLSELQRYIPEANFITLADNQGQLLIPGVKNKLGQSCRADLRHFALRKTFRELFIHRSPATLEPHVDIVTVYKEDRDHQPLTLLASLNTKPLQHLLELGETLGHRLLVTSNRTGIPSVELDSLNRQTGQPIPVQILKHSSVIHEEKIPDTLWNLVSLLDQKVADRYHDDLVQDAIRTYLFFIVITLIFLAILARNTLHRIRNEYDIVQLNTDLAEINLALEKRVQERTLQLEKQKKQLQIQATHDPLTGLLNRNGFETQLSRAIDACKTRDKHSTLLYIDIDQFKLVNDTAGHLAGDQLLKELAKVISDISEPQDILARIGGDEFALIIQHDELAKISGQAERIRMAIEQHTFFWSDHCFQVTASIGIMPINNPDSNRHTILSAVDALCYSAKRSGRNQIHYFDEQDALQNPIHQEMHIASLAMQALQQGRMELYHQKILPLNTPKSKECWSEVLVRIRDDDGQLISPREFIPALEHYGGIRKLDLLVLESAIGFLAANPLCRFNINLSRASISDNELASIITGLFRRYEVDPGRVVLEITETATVSNLDNARRFIARMKDLGCRLALDDFGSGMSSFSFLSELDFDYIKLDGSFVKDIDQSSTHDAIVKAISSVSRAMGKKTIAEYVENEAIARHLARIGIDFAQGYHLHRPEALPLS